MVNTEAFIERIKEVLDYYELTAAAFADAIGVQRSSISHLLHGRNKPSLEFVLKVVRTFPEVNLYWLLNGKGNFPSTPTLPKNIREKATGFPEKIQPKRTLKRILLIYDDGSFEELSPR